MSLWWPVVAATRSRSPLNLRTAAGQELVAPARGPADVLVENFRPGTLERWGLGPDALWRINPRLVIIRVSGFGQTGPYAPRAGFGSIGEAMGGLRYVTGEPDRPPARAGISHRRHAGRDVRGVGTLVALHARERTGRGQVVDSRIYEAVLGGDGVPDPRVRRWPATSASAPARAAEHRAVQRLPDRDGELVLIAANQDTVFRRLAEAMGRPELADDPRYATHGAAASTRPSSTSSSPTGRRP